MSVLRIAHLIAGAALIAFAMLSGAWMLAIAGVALAALGWLGVCPMYRLLGRRQH